MELDDLKAIWKNNEGFQRKNETELAAMLKGSSKSIVDKLKRNVWVETLFTLFASIAFLIYALTLENGSLKWTFISIPVLFVGYSFYYVKKLLLLARFNPSKGNLKDNLEDLTNSLTSYLNFYRHSYTILYPVYFLLGLLFAAMERGTDQFLKIVSKPYVLALLLASASIFFIFSRWLTNWYLKKLYGNHLEKLRLLLHDLETSDSSVA